MINAKEAREQSMAVQNHKIQPYLESIQRQIHRAIAEGLLCIFDPLQHTGCQLPWPDTDTMLLLRKSLESFQYDVAPNFKRISWENPKEGEL
jgi:hypothetical protein